MKKLTMLLAMAFISLVANLNAQNTISGIVKGTNGVPLPGADVIIKGTTTGVSTNFDGEFELETEKQLGEIKVSFIGYINEVLSFDVKQSQNIEVVLKENALGLDEVTLFSSRAIDRKTPVAVSVIKKEQIEEQLGNQEFVEVLKSTPGVFTTRGGGGFGDGEITLRGFNSENVAVLINGVPVNDIEDGRVFWSNWAGIGNITRSIQVQRGLGASKVAVPSIGGTINIVTETSNAQKGGRFEYGLGNDGYTKYGLKLSTGLMDNGYAATIYADRVVGDGYVDGTPFEAVTYFASVTKRINDKHKLVLTGTGAPQRHGTRFERSTIQELRSSERRGRLNKDWGIRNGEEFSLSENFFHKPLIALTHYWKVNDDNKLSTAVYYSSGKGGITFEEGADSNRLGALDEYRIGQLGPVDVDRVVRENIANGESTAFLQTRTNDHTWLGALSSYNSNLNENLALTAGLDVRYGEVEKSKELTDLLGGEFVLDVDQDINNPGRALQVGDKYGFFTKSIITTYGTFAQLEYDQDEFSAFVAANVSNTVYKREDFFDKLNSDPNQKTGGVSFVGFGGKGGFNYRLDDYNNIFVNGGYFERAPFFEAIWPTFNNDEANEDAENQKILSFELGYGLRLEKLALNLNVYRTQWNDRTEISNRVDIVQVEDPVTGAITTQQETRFANFTGVNALHQGVELDFEYRPFKTLTITGALSVGDWVWQDNVNAIIFNENQEVIEEINLFIEDLPVGRSAQTTSSLGVRYFITPETTISGTYNYADRYFADFNPSDRQAAGVDPFQIPDYGLVDFSLQHKFKIATLDAKIIARLYNAFNEEYITRAFDNGGTAEGALVNFGPGRTFSISSAINF